MKVIKGAAFLLVFSFLLGACFSEPEYPNTPEIVFDNVVFKDLSDVSLQDSLIITLSFRDGDGDLGLDAGNPADASSPYEYGSYFQAIEGQLQPISSTLATVTSGQQTNTIEYFDIQNPNAGKLAFHSLRRDTRYSSQLPAFSCNNYEFRRFLINRRALPVLDTFSKIRDTLTNATRTEIFYVVEDTLFLQRNPNHYNIEVDFLIKDPSNPNSENGFYEYDWRTLSINGIQACQNFDGRFPPLSDNIGTALEGTLRYSMNSVGFQFEFSNRTMKLRVHIRDRALNKSNVVESKEFTLAEIRQRI